MERIIWMLPDACAISEDGRLTEYVPLEKDGNAGDWILARVERLMPGLGSAFVNIGRERAGFLPLKENSLTFTGAPLRSGDRIVVQVRKEETGRKGALLTRDLTLAARTVLLMPMNRYIGVSARIREENERQRLRVLGQTLAENRFGLVMRSAAAEAPEEEVRQEVAALQETWEQIRPQMNFGSCPRVVLRSPSPAEEILSFYGHREDTRAQEAETLSTDLRRQLSEAGNRIVHLPHGGNIVIDRCEALTAVDVNSAGDSGRQGREAMLLRTNLEACREIAIQVRLRNLSGMILIDFINMDMEEHREQVQAALGKEFAADRIKTVIHGWTRLGLMEMTRKRLSGVKTQAEKSEEEPS